MKCSFTMMQLIAESHTRIRLLDNQEQTAGELTYKDSSMREARLQVIDVYRIRYSGTGKWESFRCTGEKESLVSRIKVNRGAVMELNFPFRRKVYRFKRSGAWRLRFVLLNKQGEEILGLLPTINWKKMIHDFTLQINEDFREECSSLLILHAVHCANCWMSMMNGGPVPALVSV